MDIITVLPYLLILLANVTYLFMYGYSEQMGWIQLFIFNFLIMVFVGIFLTIHINILLHRWIVQQSDKGEGKTTKKQIIKKKIAELINMKRFVQNLFLPGNQAFLVKIYLGMAVFRWLISLLPGVLSGLLLGLFFQYKKPIELRFSKQIDRVKYQFNQLVNKVLQIMPKYKGIKTITSKDYNKVQLQKVQ